VLEFSRQDMTPAHHPRVLLVDDNETILESVSTTLSHDCEIVGAVRDGVSALEAVHRLHPDVLVLDISMPGMSGLEVAGHLRREKSTVPIVFLTIHDDDELVQAAHAAGGIGYVSKTMMPSALIIAVNEACAGRRYVSRLR
jgi:DNA-binding NarL/FixJ family response regulator